jgi:ElaB/YqjD/DUF883 family membrane-anchored ribosome-binding protein
MSTTERAGPRTANDDIAARGAAAMRDIKAGLDDAMAGVNEKGREALQGAREVRDTFADAVLNSVRTRPYMTLAIAGFIGFVCGAMRRR